MVRDNAQNASEHRADQRGSVMKGRGAPRRKTLLEAKYGSLASEAVIAHVVILNQYKRALAGLAAQKKLGLGKSLLEAQGRKIHKLKDLAFDSWQALGSQPTALHNLAAIEEWKRDKKSPAFPAEVVVLEAYKAGEKSQPKLLAIGRTKNPNLTASDFSEIIKRYGLHDLVKGKLGRKSKKPTASEEVEQLAMLWMEGAIPRKQLEKKKLEILEKIEQEWLLDAQTTLEPERLVRIEREWQKHQKEDKKRLAQGMRVLSKRS